MNQMKKMLLGLVAAIALPIAVHASGGVNYSPVGPSTGTNLAIITTSAASFYNVELTSAAPGAVFSCFNSSSAAVLGTDANLLFSAVYSTAPTIITPGNYNAQQLQQIKSASIGIACRWSVAGCLAGVNWAP